MIVLVAVVCNAGNSMAQNPKAKAGVFALANATIETVTSGTIESGTIVLQGGKIVAVGRDVRIPEGAQAIDCTGLWIFPGMIDGGALLGLAEIGSDPRTRDYEEVGDVIPQLRTLSAVNPNSALIPVARVNGVTSVLASPKGRLFPGTAALINLFGYTPDQMFAGFEGVVLEYPESEKRDGDKRSESEVEKDRNKLLDKLDKTWAKAVRYAQIDSATKGRDLKYYPEMDALLPVVRGERPLLVEVNKARDIHEALNWVKAHSIPRVILTGVAEGWRVADEIAHDSIPVITGPVIALPMRDYDRYDKGYANAGLMYKAGVKVALRTMDSENVRNLPYHAGFAANYGMGREAALKAITIVPAEIFGVEDKLGSIEVGKNATLFVTNGDPFETRTEVKYVFISGWQIPLVSRQSLLYEEFLHRDPGLELNPKK